MQLRLIGATNLTAPSASIFATFSFRGTELSKTGVVTPHAQPPTRPKHASTEILGTGVVAEASSSSSSKDGASFSHVWSARHSSSTCTVPLPEESVDRRETEIEIDLWEEGGPEKEHGDHLGQVGTLFCLGTVLSFVSVLCFVLVLSFVLVQVFSCSLDRDAYVVYAITDSLPYSTRNK